MSGIDREGQLKRIDIDGIIYFDSVLGIAGTTYPIGTRELPSSVIADTITLCTLHNIRHINIRGAVVLAAAMTAYRFEGYKHLDIAHLVDLGNQDVSVSSFHRLIITGAQAGAGLASYDDCMLLSMTGFNGVATLCGLITAITLGAATSTGFINCFSYLGTCTINLGTPTVANFEHLKGSFILANQTAGLTNIWAANGCEITIAASCTGGIINIYGNARVTGAGGGVVINDYSQDTQLDTIEANQDAQTGATGVLFEQPDVAVTINAINGAETDVLNLAAANTRYKVRSLRLKCVDPNPDTVTVRLYELINDGLLEVDSFDIDTTNFGTYYSLMDMFGLSHLAGDQLQVTVRASAGGPYAVTGQYSYAKNNI